jgi:hypothetical protein
LSAVSWCGRGWVPPLGGRVPGPWSWGLVDGVVQPAAGRACRVAITWGSRSWPRGSRRVRVLAWWMTRAGTRSSWWRRRSPWARPWRTVSMPLIACSGVGEVPGDQGGPRPHGVALGVARGEVVEPGVELGFADAVLDVGAHSEPGLDVGGGVEPGPACRQVPHDEAGSPQVVEVAVQGQGELVRGQGEPGARPRGQVRSPAALTLVVVVHALLVSAVDHDVGGVQVDAHLVGQHRSPPRFGKQGPTPGR